MKTQSITILIHTDEAQDTHHWELRGSTGKVITDSTRFGDKMAFSSADGALRGAANAAHKLLWVERSC